MSFSIKGLETVALLTAKAMAAKAAMADVAAVEAAKSVASRASSNASEFSESGDLANNVVMSSPRIDGDKVIVDIGPAHGTPGGEDKEFGTMYQPAQPWLRPALDDSKSNVERAIADVIVKAML